MSDFWKIVYSKDALKEKKIAYKAGFESKIKQLVKVIQEDPFAPYPPYEKLIGDLKGVYSRRISVQHRFMYIVYKEERTVKVVAMGSHYE